jgi:exosortase A-associated hydrolase 2
MSSVMTPSAEAFFLATDDGQRYCLYYPAADGSVCRHAVVFVPPFGDEMNKSRRMLALQAQALARSGVAVLSMDLYGCGDSDGELRDASWDGWKADLAVGCDWLFMRTGAPVSLLALRLGALLALDFLAAQTGPVSPLCLLSPIKQLVLWQPVMSGAQFLNQFFRLRLASDMLSGKVVPGGVTAALRLSLQRGETLEIAGYEISPQLALPLDLLDAGMSIPSQCPVHWLEILPIAGAELGAAKMKIAQQWKRGSVELHLSLLAGTSFWDAQEISICPELLVRTVQLFESSEPEL